MHPETHRRPSDHGPHSRRKSSGRPHPSGLQPAALFPYVIRKATPGLRQRLRVERGEPVRSMRRRLQRLADEWTAELCLVLSERQAVYFTPGEPPRDSNQLPSGRAWEKPAS